MKLKKFIKKSLAMTLIFGTVFGIAGCGKDNNKNKNKEKDLPSIIDKNIDKKEKVKIVNDGVDDFVDEISFSTEEGTQVIDSSNAEYGVLVVKNQSNHIGFYSLFYQKYLLAPQFVSDWLEYSVETDSNLGHFIIVKYQNVYHMYDSLGNVVYESEKEIKLSYTTEVNKEIYVVIEEYSETLGDFEKIAIKKYRKNCSLQLVEFIPEPIYEEDGDVEENEDALDFGDLFVTQEKMDLSEYGVEGKYVLKTGNMYTLFNSLDDKKVATFVVPTTNHAIVGNKILYQTQQEVGSDSKEYSFVREDSKILVKTYSVDILTGKTEEIKTNYLFGSVKKYKDEEGKYKYALATMYEIGDRTISPVLKSALIDSKGNIVKEVTGYELKDFIKIGNNYYNETTKIIYDEKMNEIAYIGYVNPVHLEADEIFIGNENGKFGAIGYNGKIVIPFIYDSLDPLENNKGIDFKDNCLIARKGDEYFRVNKETGTAINLGSYVSQIYEDLYLMKNEENNQFTFMSQSEEYTSHSVLGTLNNQTIANKMHLNELFGEYVISFLETEKYNSIENKYYYTRAYFTHAVKALPNATVFTTIGEEISVEEKMGNSFESAISLSLGQNKVHIYGQDNENDFSYLQFTPLKDGKYIFEFEDTPHFSVYDENIIQIYAVDEDDEERKAFVIELEAGKKYYIKGLCDVGYYKYATVTVRENTGIYFDNPLVLDAPYGEISIDFTQVKTEAIFVEFTPVEYTGYRISSTNALFAQNVTSEIDLGSGLVSVSGLSYFQKDIPVKFRVEKNYSISENKAVFKIELFNKAEDGSTLLNGIKLTGDTGAISVGESETKFYEYLSSEDVLKEVVFTKTEGTPTIKLYNSKFEKLGDFLFDGETKIFDYGFSNGEKIYIEVVGKSKITVSLQTKNVKTVNFETGEYEESELTIDNAKEYYKFIPKTSSIYAFDVGNVDLSDPNVMAVLYDSNLNIISTYTAEQNHYQLVTEEPLEEGKTYYINVYSDKVNDTTSFTYKLTYEAITLYTVTNSSDIPFRVGKDGTITFVKSDMKYYDSFSSVLSMHFEKKISITFDYNLNKYLESGYSDSGYFRIFDNQENVVQLSGYYPGEGTYSNDCQNCDIELHIYKYGDAYGYEAIQPILTVSNIVVKLL